ncbi:MAG: hypothetical protein H7251_10215 [Acetobacteraceae bacterium]|nr:hypothetical protein [Acetobacteraceae bacterium]
MNIAAGVADGDAVNVGQLNGVAAIDVQGVADAAAA